jgi:arylsulfatase A-like enzyme
MNMLNVRFSKLLLSIGLIILSNLALAANTKPNILVFWGDDIGITNISAYSDGIMGYKTPNIDRIADEGIRFTDYYGDQSCTAGRSTFLTGQSGLRTGMTKVGLPGAKEGIQSRDITIAEMLKDKGYTTGQFGKNHLGDKDEHLPTNHGFDEFFGNLYHLNAEEEPEDPDYPKGPEFKKKFGPRGIIHSYADGKIEDTGPLTKKRMETADDEFVAAAQKFIAKAVKNKKPFFVWMNTTGMHFRTHINPEHVGKSGQGFYNDAMVAHDENVGQMLDQLDNLKIADNTIVMYSTDNGVHYNTWPDAGITPFAGEKNSEKEGAYRVPMMVRWPGKIPANKISNEIMAHLDWMPTFAAAAGDNNLKSDMLKGKRFGKKNAKIHLDGYNMLPHLMGKEEKSPRQIYHYLNDEGFPVAIRVGDWKIIYAEVRAKTMALWTEPFTVLRMPKVTNLRRDPFSRAEENSNSYYDWMISKAPYIYLSLGETAKFLSTFKEYPPSQPTGSWSVEAVYDMFLGKSEGK